MKCKTMRVYLGTEIVKEYRQVERVSIKDGELRILTDKDFICFDMAIVAYYECLDYEIENPTQ